MHVGATRACTCEFVGKVPIFHCDAVECHLVSGVGGVECLRVREVRGVPFRFSSCRCPRRLDLL